MTEKYSQTIEDFHGRLNMGVFSNIEKSYNTDQIKAEFGQDCMILEKGIITSFIEEIYKSIGGEIQKGKFNDIPEAHQLLEKAKADLSELTRVVLFDGTEDMPREVYVMKAKAEEFQKGKDSEEFEKGHITNAFDYSSLLKFEKTGAEIKEKAKVEKDHCESEVKTIEEKLQKFSLDNQNEIDLPTEKPYLYGTAEKLNCPYLRYHWCLTDYYEGRDMNTPYVLSNGKQCYPSATAEEAAKYNEWNKLVNEWIEEKKEIMLLDLFINNFEDKKKYELNAQQMVALGF